MTTKPKPISMLGYMPKPGKRRQRMPKHAGIYPVTLSTGERTCAKWHPTEGGCWSLWCEVFDPPCWDPAVMLNCRVVEWRRP